MAIEKVEVVQEEPTPDPLAEAVAAADEELAKLETEDPIKAEEAEAEVAEEQPQDAPEDEAEEAKEPDAAEEETDETVDDEEAEKEPEGKEESEAELISVALPEALQEQGLDAFHVESQAEADALTAMVKSYETVAVRETNEQELVDRTHGLEDELAEFRMTVNVDPFGVVGKILDSQDPGQAEAAFRHYLLDNAERWDSHLEWMTGLHEDGTVEPARRELALSHRERIATAQDNAVAYKNERAAATELNTQLDSRLGSVPEQDREFVRKGIVADVHAASEEAKRRGGSDVVTVEALNKLADPWIERFGSAETETSEGGEAPKDESAAQPESKGAAQVRKLVSTRKEGQKIIKPGGAPPTKAIGPKKNQTLDEVVADLKTGKLAVQ